MKSLDSSDDVEGQLDKYRRTPGPVELEDGGGAVMAAIEVNDGVNDGPDASALFVHIATEDLRDVDRYESHAKGKRARKATRSTLPVQVWHWRGQSRHRCGIARPVPVPMWH